ncbi:TPA: hypothetical protein I7678_21940 [Vibrio vulnificus]|nr:hypothetical protein D8T55_20725 [Vibrio vulnificus]HAS8151883.1 hypothetical protein [Vibrio vulnificus]
MHECLNLFRVLCHWLFR